MLNKKQKYLQIALNSTLEDAIDIITRIPLDERIIIEVGTPLIKNYGLKAIRTISNWWKNKSLIEHAQKKSFNPYIVADLKCMDRGTREVQIAKQGGANAGVVLGQAPLETINAFIEECSKEGLDSMVDMMNVEFPLSILRQLKKPPSVVIIHRGVDEEMFDPESEIPYHEISRIKNEFEVLVGVAGGDTLQEVQRAIFNDADIVVIWKSVYQSSNEVVNLVKEFLKEIR